VTGSLRFEVLGPVRAWRGDAEVELGPPQQRAALAVLLLQEGTPLSPSQLVSALWSGAEPRAAVGMVRSYVSRLRHAGVEIESIGGGYALRAATLDVTEFERLIRTGEARAALRLWHGTPLSGLTGDYAEAARVRLSALRTTAREALAAADIESGRHAEAISDLTDLIASEPLRERPHELRMLALYRSGRQAEALEVFTQIQRLLEAELGLYPGPELQEMQRRILAADPSLTATAAASPPTQLPPDLPEFAGRAVETTALSAALTRSTTSVPVIGIEGLAAIGKTTLAVHIGHSVTAQFPDGQLFLDLSASPDPLSELLRGIGVPNPPTSSSERAALWRTRTTGRRVLMVLDNARDTDEVRPLIPAAGAVLITARRRLYGLAHWTKLPGLSPAASMELLEHLIGSDRVHREPAATSALVARMAGLPQVLQAVGARLASRPGWSMAEAVDRLGRPAPGSPVTPPECGAIEKPYESALAELSPAEARAFRLLSLSETPEISVAAASSILNLPLPDTAVLLESLADAHLLDPSGTDRYRYQEPLRMFARGVAQVEGTESMQRA
jgi:DNA-binding SARP family transcriptional activator